MPPWHTPRGRFFLEFGELSCYMYVDSTSAKCEDAFFPGPDNSQRGAASEMEQLTPGEWAKAQLKRAPSFAVASAIVAAMLVVSTFIQYAEPANPPTIDPVEAEIAEEEPPPLEEIKDRIEPEQPKLDPAEVAPAMEEENVVPVNAPLDDVTADIEFTEDPTSDALESSDPFPMELTKKMAVIGTASGAGGFRGVLGSRTKSGKRRAARRFGMPKGTDKDILAGLRWLKKVQNKETGGWDAQNFEGRRGVSRGVSGLALLAFLGFGCTDKRPLEFASTVKKAMKYLVDVQETTGGEDAKSKRGWFGEQMYTQGICTMALAEAYAMMGRRDCERAAQMGLEYILRKQPAHGAFSYGGPGNDVSVTGFQIQAIKAAYVAGLRVPKEARQKTERFLRICMAKNYGTPYRIDPMSEVQKAHKLSMTAASLTGRLFMGHKRGAPDCVGQAEYIIAGDKHLQVAKQASNYYVLYYMSLSMFNMGGKYWKGWNNAFNAPLRARQVEAGPDMGSWPGGGAGGRVFSTAMACLALEVYFRFLPTYKSF